MNWYSQQWFAQDHFASDWWHGQGHQGGGQSVKTKLPPKELFDLKPIGEIVNGREILYSEIDIPQIQSDFESISQSLKLIDEDRLYLDSTIKTLNQSLSFLRIIKKKEEKPRIFIVNTLDLFSEEEVLLLLMIN